MLGVLLFIGLYVLLFLEVKFDIGMMGKFLVFYGFFDGRKVYVDVFVFFFKEKVILNGLVGILCVCVEVMVMMWGFKVLLLLKKGLLIFLLLVVMVMIMLLFIMWEVIMF